MEVREGVVVVEECGLFPWKLEVDMFSEVDEVRSKG